MGMEGSGCPLKRYIAMGRTIYPYFAIYKYTAGGHDSRQPAPQTGPMNYLAHLHLGGAQPAQLLGSLYGDFVKGPLEGRFPEPVEAAIRLHRRIDAYTDAHPLVQRAKQRFRRSTGASPAC
jgi:hypothetical protein